MGLDDAALVERDVVADLHQRAFGEIGPTVIDALADLHAERPQDDGAEGGAGEEAHNGRIRQFPVALVPPEGDIVDGRDLRLELAEAEACPFHEDVEGNGDGARQHDRGEQCDICPFRIVVQRAVPDGERHEQCRPLHGNEHHRGREVVAVLVRKARTAIVVADALDQLLVALDHARDFEGRRAQEADILAHRPVDRHHDLGAQKHVVARAPVRRIEDVVAEIVALADLGMLEPEGGGRFVDVDHVETVRHHGARADLAEQRVVLLLVAAEVGARLDHRVEVPAKRADIVHDGRTVTEEQVEQPGVRADLHDGLQPEMEAIKPVDAAGLQDEAEQARQHQRRKQQRAN